LKEVYEFVDKNSESFLEEFREFIRKPGISTENTGIKETVSWLAMKMKENGVENVQTFGTQRHPVVLGRVGKGAKRTLLVYGHYDVQPPGDRQNWTADPFAAEVVGDRIIGRGTCDMKNNLMASIHAVRAVLQCKKAVPINLIFLFEGEEEIGSPSLKPFIEEHKEELSTCDSILCAEGGENKSGQILLFYGCKGMLYLELSAESPTGAEVHSMYAGMIDNPAWRLVSALQSLKEDEKVLIPHFYEGVKEPGLKEKIKYGLARVAINKEKLEEAFELKIKKGMSVSAALLEAFYKPTLNIDGLFSGYTVKRGIKTVVPNSAWAKIDMRLVPGQDPSTIFENTQKHLESKGFNDIVVEKLGALPAYRVDPDERIVDVVSQALTKVVSKKTMAMPILPGSGAMVWLPHILGKPMAFAGSGAAYMAHKPNEFVTIQQYLKGIKLFATIYNDYAS
jgi:Acetylornithine deacetylase/Succinyl-diaminopimelate desuccinylase and related deacylases